MTGDFDHRSLSMFALSLYSFLFFFWERIHAVYSTFSIGNGAVLRKLTGSLDPAQIGEIWQNFVIQPI